jgi:D-lactate dehydrogenase (cytochrome)
MVRMEAFDIKYENRLRDESGLIGFAEYFAAPETIDELSGVIKEAAARGFPMTIQGSRTGLCGGGVPMGGLLISLEKMNAVPELLQTGERPLLKVLAGASLNDIENFINRRIPGYFFAPNPTQKTASIGGLFACNAKGLNSARYGRISDHVAGLVWITPKGDVWRLKRGEYRFNDTGCLLPDGSFYYCDVALAPYPISAQIARSGLDLIDFLAASEGRLGAAAQFELQLTAKPSESWGVVYFFTAEEAAGLFLKKICRRETGLQWDDAQIKTAAACEFYNENILSLLRRGMDTASASNRLPDFPDGSKCAVYVEVSGDDERLLEQVCAELQELFQASGGDDSYTWAGLGESELEKFRNMRHLATELANDETYRHRSPLYDPLRLAFDFILPFEKSWEFWQNLRADRISKINNIAAHASANALEGRFEIQLIPRTKYESEICADAIERWARSAASTGAEIFSGNGVGKLRSGIAWELLSETRKNRYRELKTCFDPQNILGGYY